jgi:hypothetical protein
MKQDAFRRYAAIDASFPLADIRYVRLRDRGRDKGPAIDLITREQDLTLKFYSWAKDGAGRRLAEQFADVLGTFMHIPAEEIPAVQVPELEAPADVAAELE